MHQFGQEGFCLIWAVNNALQRKLLTVDDVLREIHEEDVKDKSRDVDHYIGLDGLDFETFRKILREDYKIRLVKVHKITKHGRYLVTYDFGDYYHTIAVYNGKPLDSRKKLQIKSLQTRRRLVDIYRLYL